MYHSPVFFIFFFILDHVALRPCGHVSNGFSEKCHLYNQRSDALTFSKKQTSLSKTLLILCLSQQKNSPVNIYSLVVFFFFFLFDLWMISKSHHSSQSAQSAPQPPTFGLSE